MFRGLGRGRIGVRGCIEPATQTYERSVAYCPGEAAVGFATVQGLGAAEDAAICFNDLSEVPSHGATMKAWLEPTEPPSTESVETSSSCTQILHAVHGTHAMYSVSIPRSVGCSQRDRQSGRYQILTRWSSSSQRPSDLVTSNAA